MNIFLGTRRELFELTRFGKPINYFVLLHLCE